MLLTSPKKTEPQPIINHLKLGNPGITTIKFLGIALVGDFYKYKTEWKVNFKKCRWLISIFFGELCLIIGVFRVSIEHQLCHRYCSVNN